MRGAGINTHAHGHKHTCTCAVRAAGTAIKGKERGEDEGRGEERRGEESRGEGEGRGEERRTFWSRERTSVLRAAASSELITQSKRPLCGGLMGHSERKLAVHNLLRNQLVPKIRVEQLEFVTCTLKLGIKINVKTIYKIVKLIYLRFN